MVNRIENVLLKLARGHATYELNEPQLEEPDVFWARPIFTMSLEEYDTFEERPKPGVIELGVWPEVGSRMMSRLLIVEQNVFEERWLVVQPDRYRYRMSWDDGIGVRIVLREFLACHIAWH